MLYNKLELSVLIKDTEITEYPHDGRIYVEGRAGSNFTIRIKNSNPFRVEAVVSVDGLSVVDGKDAGKDSDGYVVDAHSTLDIPGFMLSDKQVAAFEFAGKKDSYAGAVTGSTRNVGVIGLMAFKETQQPPISWQTLQYSPFVAPPGSSGYGAGDNLLRGLNSKSVFSASASNTNHVEQTLGTAFGKATDFATHTVSFERGDMISMIIVYYDDRKGLEQRGIMLTKRKTKSEPNAFPGNYCAPPKGWRG